MLALHDTATKSVGQLLPEGASEMSLYVCGPTVYEMPHLGHGRALLVYDVLRRFLESQGISVRHVSNVTDVDDKIIDRAAREGTTPAEVARRYEAAWWDASDRLGVLRPAAAPRATEYVATMAAMVAEMVARGMAYSTAGGVYLDVASVPDYGLLAGQPLDSLRSGARVEVAGEKRGPHDFVLWKPSKPGEPEWESPWGPGRPGWHTECVAMSLDLLGESFDLHAGGMDLQFPHHENERAQSAVLGRRFARHWMHHAFVTAAGEKMARSAGNFTTLTDLVERTDPRAYRLLVLRSHYRQPLEVTGATIQAAEEALGRLDALADRLSPEGQLLGADPDPDVVARFRSRMEDDLDTPAAIAVLFSTVTRANAAADRGRVEASSSLAAAVLQSFASVGLNLGSVHDRLGPAAGPEPGDEALDLLGKREQARAERDFATADSIRERLAGMGWAVEDTPSGARIRWSRR